MPSKDERFVRSQWPAIQQVLTPRCEVSCLLALIGRYLRAGVPVGNAIQATEVGTPRGSPLSPLLINTLSDDLDKELGRVDGLSAQAARQVPSRLDELLRHLGLPPADPRDRLVDPQAHPDVLPGSMHDARFQKTQPMAWISGK